jgi:hypothetical protein
MPTLLPLYFALSMFFQAGAKLPALDGIFNAQEKAGIAQSSNLKGRIKVYTAASTRIQKDLQAVMAAEEFQKVPSILKTWTLLLSESFKDIEAGPKLKKPLRALINYEIQLRKAIALTHDYKIRAPADRQDDFITFLDEAAMIRKKIVDILFLH